MNIRNDSNNNNSNSNSNNNNSNNVQGDGHVLARLQKSLRGGGVQKLLSQFQHICSLRNRCQEVVVYRISLPIYTHAQVLARQREVHKLLEGLEAKRVELLLDEDLNIIIVIIMFIVMNNIYIYTHICTSMYIYIYIYVQ